MTQIKLAMTPAEVHGLAMDSAVTVEGLEKLGIGFYASAMNTIHTATLDAIGEAQRLGYATDGLPATLTTPSIGNALQFFQHFFAEPVMTITTARMADRILGRTVAGTWADEEIVTQIVEPTGQARPYGDTSNFPMADFNINFERRNIVRMELGLEVNRLELDRSSRMRVSSADVKRNAISRALAISLNDIAFRGYNNGTGRTYGMLNDPNLPEYVNVPAGGGTGATTQWSTKTFAEITADIRSAVSDLLVRTGANFNPRQDSFKMVVALSSMEYLNTTTDFGISVIDWIKRNYPGCEIIAAPQFDGANGGANVAYFIVDRLDGVQTVHQFVPAAFFLVGAQPTAKGLIEDYSAATAGVEFVQPLGVVRISGI